MLLLSVGFKIKITINLAFEISFSTKKVKSK